MGNTSLQLEDLKTSNLPELQGWKEKQEALVIDNPYVEIVDNKTYEVACKNRTSLLKGRTELEKQDKLIASKLSNFRKEVKSETDALILITQPSEEKQQAEVKRYEGKKEQERLEKQRLEEERIHAINAKIDAIESESFAIIQAMTFNNIIKDGAAIALICKTDFDFEEYEITYHQTLLRIENATLAKIEDLNEKEYQRIANEKLEQDNRILKEKQELQASRLNEIFPYIIYIKMGESVFIEKLYELEESVYSELLASKKALFEADAKDKQEAQELLEAENLERENKAKADKEKIFEIRKGRLEEIGFVMGKINDSLDNDVFVHENILLATLKETIFDSDAIDFETIITDAKLAIEKSKSDAEEAENQKTKDLELAKADAIKMKSANKARVKKYANDKSVLLDFVNSLDFRNPIPELENEDLQPALDELLNVLIAVKSDFESILNKF
jgi:hypothetical protein